MDFVRAQHGYFDGRNRPRWIVIHDMEYPKRVGAARWCANYFAGPNAPPKSAHYCIDANETVQSVRDQDGAWHTPGFAAGLEVNRNSIGIEHAGYANQSAAEWADAYSSAELERSAALTASLATRLKIPTSRRLTVNEIQSGQPGFAGHVDFTRATGSGSHTDPGTHFPWDTYLARVRAHQSGEASQAEASPLRTIVLATAAGIGIWALLNPSQAQRAIRRILPI